MALNEKQKEILKEKADAYNETYESLLEYFNDKNLNSIFIDSKYKGLVNDLRAVSDDSWTKSQIEENNNRIAHLTDVNTFYESKRIDYTQTDPGIDNGISENLLKEYGNNYFELFTYNQYQKYVLNGVLKQIPSFSKGTAWEEGPSKSVSDAVNEYLNSDMINKIMAIGGREKTWLNLDEGTDRTFKSTTEPSFSLEFRVYTTEQIGSQKFSTWKEWLNLLILFCQPSLANKINISSMLNNIGAGVVGVIDKLDTIKKGMETLGKTKPKENTEESSNWVETIAEGVNNVAKTIADVASNVQYDMEQRDGIHRVSSQSNMENFYGGKLWKLRIMPGIIQRPIIVYINDWSITYSKELNEETKEPVYIDFNIKCNMDQSPNAGLWMYYLDNTVNENGYFYEMTETDKYHFNTTYDGLTLNIQYAKENQEYNDNDILNLEAPEGYKFVLNSKNKWIIKKI